MLSIRIQYIQHYSTNWTGGDKDSGGTAGVAELGRVRVTGYTKAEREGCEEDTEASRGVLNQLQAAAYHLRAAVCGGLQLTKR